MPRKPRGFGGRAPKDKMCNIPYSFYPEICLFVSYIKEVVVHFTVNQDIRTLARLYFALNWVVGEAPHWIIYAN